MKAPFPFLPLAALIAASASLAASGEEPSGREARGIQARTVRTGGATREYFVYVPKSWDGRTRVPVVVMLHGGGGTAKAALEETGWDRKAEEKGFLAVFPEATRPDPAKPPGFSKNAQIWNDGSGRFHAGQEDVPDVAFLGAVLDDLEAAFAVDRRRVYVTGFSNGSSMAFRAAAEMSGRFAAAAPVAGALWLEEVKLARGVPLLYITGTADPLNPLPGGVPRLAAGGEGLGGRKKPPVLDHVKKWAAATGAPETPTFSASKDGVSTEVRASLRGADVVFVTVEGMGHTWAGGKSLLPESLVGKTSDRLKATDAIWDFFAAHPMAPESSRVGFSVVEFRVSSGGKEKPLAVAVWYPTDAEPRLHTYGGTTTGLVAPDAKLADGGGPRPLLVFSHGYGGGGIGHAYLAESLASRGWIVAAPDHNDRFSALRSRTGQVPDLDAAGLLRHAREISESGPEDRDKYLYRVDELEGALKSLVASPAFGRRIDPEKIAVGGHSFGGFTALGLCGALPGRRDPRIKAVLIHSSGAAGYLYRDEDLRKVGVPSLSFYGEREKDERRGDRSMLQIAEGIYRELPSPKHLLELSGGTHFSFNQRFSDAEGARRMSGTEAELAAVRDRSVAFLEFYVLGDPCAQGVLQAGDAMLTRQEQSER